MKILLSNFILDQKIFNPIKQFKKNMMIAKKRKAFDTLNNILSEIDKQRIPIPPKIKIYPKIFLK